MNLPKNIVIDSSKKMGEGDQGVVYLIDTKRCIKLYKHSKYFRRELACMQQAGDEPIFPRLYDWGNYYIIREYIPGDILGDYLSHHRLTPNMARQLLDIYKAFERLNFKRLDTQIRHIVVTPSKKLRIIDPTNLMNFRCYYPRMLMDGLEYKGYKDVFMKYVEKSDPKLYESWH